MKTLAFTLLFIVAFITFGADGPLRSVEELAADYAEFLTNVTFQLRHGDVVRDSLDGFRKTEDYSPEAMLKALVSIVERDRTSTNAESLRMAGAAIHAMGYMQLTNALPMLRKWTLAGGDVATSSFNAYGRIAGYDEQYLELGMSAVNSQALCESFFYGKLCTRLSLDNSLANGQKLPQRHWLHEKVKCKMARIVINFGDASFESCMNHEEIFARCIDGYTNSLEHVRVQRRINDFLIQRKEHILKKSACRIVGKNRLLSDEEWYRRATNSCQTEIARVMALPENKRLNMTAILDAKIVAIEAAEARAARREIWKRRLRFGAIVLPIPVIALAAIVARRRMKR